MVMPEPALGAATSAATGLPIVATPAPRDAVSPQVDGVALSRLIDAFYVAATEPQSWPEVLAAAARLIGAERVHLVADGTLDLARLGLQHGFSDEELARYRREFSKQDPWRRPPGALAPNHSAVLRCADLVDSEELLASGIYRGFFAPLGIRWCIGCAVAPLSAGAPMYVLRFFRGEHAGGFGAEAELVVGELGHHLLRIERLAAAALAQETPAAAAQGAHFVLAESGQLVQCDAAGAALLANGALRRALPRLRFAASAADAWLAAALSALRDHDFARRQLRQPGVVGKNVESRLELVTLNAPSSSPLMLAARYLLRVSTVRACSREQAAREAHARFGWTEAEFDVALRVGNGATIAAIAQARGTTLDTVRSHVKSIKRKTGVRRVADLIRLVAELTDGLRLRA